MHTLTDEAEFEALKGEHDVLVAYFTRDTCSVGESVFPKVAAQLEGSEVPLVSVDVTALPSVAGQHMVFAVPTLLVFVFGREFARHARIFSLSQVEDAVERARAVVDAA
jgi:thioredoxin-like negative regulator of GroEL